MKPDKFDQSISPFNRVKLAQLKKGQRVTVDGFGGGAATILRVQKNGAVWVRTDDGIEGTTTIQSLRT